MSTYAKVVQGVGLQTGCRPSKADNAATAKHMLSKTGSNYICQAIIFLLILYQIYPKKERSIFPRLCMSQCTHFRHFPLRFSIFASFYTYLFRASAHSAFVSFPQIHAAKTV
ncbi:MAG: hypothetical protein IJA67_04125 [Oscillospiraceae bacterium]|nr:hypothetical protein [Oscillospiraceae bacterium]